MYDYSPISKLYVRNFRNLGDVEISFKESPIVTLVGENEAGKTSVIKAFATCALHANPRDQKDYIRDGTKMFGVAIELENGKRITRVKEAGGINSYQITDSNGNLIWNTNKLAEGLPTEVQKIMGLIAEPETNEFLHIRTYEDKLLFVVTPNSTNYKVMYNALKVEQLTKAIKMGSTEVNALKSEINSNESSIQTLQSQLKSITIVDTEPLTNVKNRLIEQMAVLDKLSKAKALLERVYDCERRLGALALIDKFQLSNVNEMLAFNLANVSRLVNKNTDTTNLLSKINEVSNLEIIDTNTISRVGNILEKVKSLDTKIKEAGALVHVSELSEISEVEVVQLTKAETLINRVSTLEKQASKIDTSHCSEVSDISISAINKLSHISEQLTAINSGEAQLVQINNYIEQVQNYMKQCGVAVETCPNCGGDVIFDIDKMGV
jgi:predicted ATPase